MQKTSEPDSNVTWEQIMVDGRIADVLRALELMYPLKQQQEAIIALLNQKDLLLSSKTGTGKTLSYLIPCIQYILSQITTNNDYKHETQILILEPTKELVLQTFDLLKALTRDFNKFGFQINVEKQFSDQKDQQSLKKTKTVQVKPDILITTPKQIEKIENLDKVKILVVDEADTMFAFDLKDVLQSILSKISYKTQKILCSATLSTDVQQFSELMLVNPTIVKDLEKEQSNNEQACKYNFFTYQTDIDKYMIAYALFKLNILQERTIIYTPKINESYRLKYFLDKFGCRPLLFSPQHPLEQRTTQIQKFNYGASNILIICGEQSDEENGVIRGVDFENVRVVVCFSLPHSYQDLIHISGRAGRGLNEPGVCISLVIDIDEDECQNNQLKIEFKQQNKLLQQFIENKLSMEYQEMDMIKLRENFGYRVRDVWSQMTEPAMKKYKLAQLQKMLMESDKIQAHFQQHQKDKQIMKAAIDGPSSGRALQTIPDYFKQQADEIRNNCSLIIQQQQVVKSHSYQNRSKLLRKLGKK